MPEEFYDVDFPNLKKLGFARTSDQAYPNCIAFVVGDNNRKWWPGEYSAWSLDYWPKEAPLALRSCRRPNPHFCWLPAIWLSHSFAWLPQVRCCAPMTPYLPAHRALRQR